MSYNNLDIYLTSTSGSINISNPVPMQNLRLVGYRVKFDTADHAAACDFIRFNTPFFRGNTFIGGCETGENSNYNFGAQGLILFLENNICTVQYPNSWISCAQMIPEAFNYSIEGIDLTGFQSLHLIIGYDSGGIIG